MPTVDKLTKRFVDDLKFDPAGAALQIHFEKMTPGFGVQVFASGVRTFVVKYRTQTGQQRRPALGKFGRLTVEQARDLAKKTLLEVSQGTDPVAEKAQERAVAQQERAAPTVAEAGEAFLAWCEAHLKVRTSKEYRRMWTKDVVPAFGAKKLLALTAPDVSALHTAMSKKKYMANQVVNLISNFYNWCMDEGNLLPEGTPNPARKKKVKRYKERSRERYLTPDEMRTFGETLERARLIGIPSAPRRNKRKHRVTGATAKHIPKSVDVLQPSNPYAVACIALLVLSGLRKNEATSLTWKQVEQAREIASAATLPDAKGGTHHHRLGRTAIAFLMNEQYVPRIPGCPFVFPGDPAFRLTNGKKVWRHIAEFSRVWNAVRIAAGIPDVRLHDLRHSFASAIAKSGGSLLMIQELLGHKDIATTKKYVHLIPSEVTQVAHDTSATITKLLNEGAAKVERPAQPLD